MNLNNFIYETEVKNFHDTLKQITNDFNRDERKPDNLLMPRTDIIERENSFNLFLELPGLNKDEITIKFENGFLSVSGEKKSNGEENIKVKLSERLFGKFERRFKLGEKVDTNAISAEFVNGLLAVSIPKKQPVKFEQTIEIK